MQLTYAAAYFFTGKVLEKLFRKNGKSHYHLEVIWDCRHCFFKNAPAVKNPTTLERENTNQKK